MRRRGRLKGVPLGFTSFAVWGSDVHLGRWADYDGDTLRDVYGTKWHAALDDVIERGFLAVRGVRAGGTSAILADGMKGDTSSPNAAPPGRRLGSGVDTLIRHLHTIERVDDYEDVVRLILTDGPAWAKEAIRAWLPKGAKSMTGADLKALSARARRVNSSGKGAHDANCPYCGSGLPKRLHDAVTTRKRP